jgi:hypothetical protein
MFKYLTRTFSSHEHTDLPLVEDSPDVPPTVLATAVVVISFLTVFASILISFPLVQKLVDAQTEQADTGMGNSSRLDYLAAQQKLLSSFEKIDDTHVRIPITQAMKMVVDKQGNVFSQQDELK